jgi:hypothetical protein
MNLKLKRIAPLQAGKMLAALYGAISLIMVPFVLVFMAIGSFAARQQGGAGLPAAPLMLGMGMGFVILLPFFYALMGFLAGVIGAWVYNLIAGPVGGLEFEFEAKSPPPL